MVADGIHAATHTARNIFALCNVCCRYGNPVKDLRLTGSINYGLIGLIKIIKVEK